MALSPRGGRTGLLVPAADVANWGLIAGQVGVMALSVGLLRRRPLSALALLLTGAAVSMTLGVQQMALPSFITLFTPKAGLLVPLTLVAGVEVCAIAATRPRRSSVTAAVVTLGVLAACLGLETSTGTGVNAAAILTVVLIIAVAWLTGHAVRQAQVHAEELRDRAYEQASIAERLRIARDLHDMVAHSIGIIAIQAGAGRRVIGTQPDEARNALAAIEATSRETLAGLRRMVGALRRAAPGHQTGPAPLDPVPGLAGIGQLAAATRDVGLQVDVQWRGQRRPLPPDIDLSAYRIIQEAVTNVVRHAGAGQCHILIDQDNEELSIEITDDGRGGEIGRTGYGLTGMRERANLLHGHLTAGPRPGGGFCVAARLPVPGGA